MIRRLIAAVSASAGLMFSIYLASGGTVAEQAAFLADGGFAPNRDATCPVRLDPDFAAGLALYQRAKFPVSLVILEDGGRDITLPPMPVQRLRAAIDVVDWNDCTIVASTGPIAALWGTSKPFTTAGVVRPWCRQRTDAGLPCALLDGGTFGDMNVGPCASRLDPATCERVSGGTIYSGDSEEGI